MKGFEVPSTNATPSYSDEHFSWTNFRNINLFQPKVRRGMIDHRFHFPGQIGHFLYAHSNTSRLIFLHFITFPEKRDIIPSG